MILKDPNTDSNCEKTNHPTRRKGYHSQINTKQNEIWANSISPLIIWRNSSKISVVSSSVNFFVWNEKNKYFRLSENIFVRLENIFGFFSDFARNSLQIKGKIIVETGNIKKNRLRRATKILTNVAPNYPKLIKLAPEGRDFFWEWKYFGFTKTKKNTLVSRYKLRDFPNNLLPNPSQSNECGHYKQFVDDWYRARFFIGY